MSVDVFVCRLRGNTFVLIYNKVVFFYHCMNVDHVALLLLFSRLSQKLLILGDCN